MDIGASSMQLVSKDASHLGDHLTKFLKIKEDQDLSDEIKPKSYKDHVSENTHCSYPSNLATERGLIKFATFPSSSKSTSGEFIDRKEEPSDYESSANQLLSHSKSLPTPLKLKSVLKGSREKLGTPPPEMLSVKWAPDVYDPVPTSVSHVPKNKPRHKSDGKKKGKNKQKNSAKSSRGSKGKDKKQVRKHGSSSNSNRDFPHFDESSSNIILVSPSEFQTSIADFDIGSPVAFCGSSFLKKSVPKLHFAVAEAT